jgi:hypothetical protein
MEIKAKYYIIVVVYYENEKCRIIKNYPNDSAYDLCANTHNEIITLPPWQKTQSRNGN